MIITRSESRFTLAEGQWIDRQGRARLDAVHTAVRKERLRYAISQREVARNIDDDVIAWKAALSHPRGEISNGLSNAMLALEMSSLANEDRGSERPEHVHRIRYDPMALLLLRKVAEVDHHVQRRLFEDRAHDTPLISSDIERMSSLQRSLDAESLDADTWIDMHQASSSYEDTKSLLLISVTAGIYHAITAHFK